VGEFAADIRAEMYGRTMYRNSQTQPPMTTPQLHY
jgi:hypothetical protein